MKGWWWAVTNDYIQNIAFSGWKICIHNSFLKQDFSICLEHIKRRKRAMSMMCEFTLRLFDNYTYIITEEYWVITTLSPISLKVFAVIMIRQITGHEHVSWRYRLEPKMHNICCGQRIGLIYFIQYFRSVFLWNAFGRPTRVFHGRFTWYLNWILEFCICMIMTYFAVTMFI